MAVNGRHPVDLRMAACAAYLVEGDSKRVSRLTGVPARTIRDWTTQEWWGEAMEKLRVRYQERLDAKLTAIMDAALSAVLNQLEHGDEVLNRDSGTVTRRMVSAKDAAIIFAVFFDKRALLRGQPTSRVERVNLDRLRARFNAIVDRVQDANQ